MHVDALQQAEEFHPLYKPFAVLHVHGAAADASMPSSVCQARSLCPGIDHVLRLRIVPLEAAKVQVDSSSIASFFSLLLLGIDSSVKAIWWARSRPGLANHQRVVQN